MGLLIDSDVLIGLERTRELPERILARSRDETTFIAAITASELLHGVERAEGKRRIRRQRFVETVLAATHVLPFDLAVARVHASLWARLQQRGAIIGAHDLQIAATALAHQLPLATENVGEFSRVDGLRIL